MNNYEISVLPFYATAGSPPPWQIGADIVREIGILNINLAINGETDSILLDLNRDDPVERRDELWKHTCFELFIAEPGKNNYWEYNLAPNGHWNCYQFSHYRSPPIKAEDAGVINSRIWHSGNQVNVSYHATLATELHNKTLEANLCCVIENKNHQHYYHASAHPADKPDFHDRRGFVLNIPA